MWDSIMGSSMSGWIWFNSSVLQLYSTSTQHMLITDIGIYAFIPELFIKYPPCARHRVLISLFIKNLSFAVYLWSPTNSSEHTTQNSTSTGGSYWLVSRGSASFVKSHFFSSWGGTDKSRATRKQPLFLTMSFLIPKKKFSPTYMVLYFPQ